MTSDNPTSGDVIADDSPAVTVPPPHIPPVIARHLRGVIDYNWAAEEADYDENPADIHVFVALRALREWLTDTPPTVPNIGDQFEHQGRQHTVASWLKRNPAPTADSRSVGPDRCPLVFCPRDEAEYVGFTGGILRVADVKVTGRAGWTEESFFRHISAQHARNHDPV